MHGHTYHLKIWLKGTVNEEGWVMDFAILKTVVKKVIDLIDHKCLNTIKELENPTSEVLVQWIWQKLQVNLPLLYEIELRETPTSGVVYSGEQ
jgi:6-pyruvoyltetrahydropterin/6-carboxytetrahydropterin synthase